MGAMRLALTGLTVALLAWTTAAQGQKKLCPVKGQQFPVPTGLSKEALFQNATKTIEEHIKANLTTSPYNVTSFSLGFFSVDEEALSYEYHHTDDTVRNSTLGTHSVDANSIFRIASISKILTVYLWMIKEGDRRWNDPVSDHIPELAAIDRSQYDYAVPAWDEITIGDLASFLAGIAREYGLNDLLPQGGYVTKLLKLDPNEVSDYSVPQFDVPTCGYLDVNASYATCTPEQSARGSGLLAASFPPGYTPLYSNANFALLGTALANLVGKPLEEIFTTSLIEPLGLTGTTLGNPSNITDRSVIPDSDATSWNNVLGPQDPAAGAFSTVHDLALIGKAILNSTLTSTSTTRRWFTSTSFVNSIDQAVGRGWEIFRRRLPGSGGYTIDIYTKSGYWGPYTSIFVLIPTYNFGFTLLTSCSAPGAGGQVRDDLPNVIVNTLLPVLDQISRLQAQQNFAGQYVGSTSNTSFTIVTDENAGLKVTEYTTQGLDVLNQIFGNTSKVDTRILPNLINYADVIDAGGNGTRKRVGFTSLFQRYPQTGTEEQDGEANDWYWPCQTWLDIDDFTLANIPLGQVVFEVDEQGRACAVRLEAFRERLERKQVG